MVQEREAYPPFDLERPDWHQEPFESVATAILRFSYILALRLMHSHDDAEDVAQRALITFNSYYPHLKRGVTIAPWIMVIVRNMCLTLIRKRRTTYYGVPFSACRKSETSDEFDCFLEDTHLYTLPDDVAERNERIAAVREAVATLPERYKDVIHFRYDLDLSFKEIAECMQIKENTAKTWFRRARLLLAEPLSVV